MADLSELKLYLTTAHQCGYLEREQSSSLFVDPKQELDQSIFSELSNLGFRRSGAHVYRPHCESCNACIPIRLPVDYFVPSTSQKRVMKKNNDLRFEIVSSIQGDEYYSLYERYINLRHKDGEMYPPSRDQYEAFLSNQWGVTQHLVARDQNQKLISVAVIDRLNNGLSALYTFFEPDEAARSLGVLSILKQIELAQQMGLPYLFLGYWIKDCQKMSYKTKYRPFQLFISNQWMSFS